MTEEIDNVFEKLLWDKIDKQIYRHDSSIPDLPFKLIEIWVLQDPSGDISTTCYPFSRYATQEYAIQDLEREPKIRTHQGYETLGGLRLVVQEWPRTWPNKLPEKDDGNEFVSWIVARRTRLDESNGDNTESEDELASSETKPGLLPFSKRTLEMLIKALNLPLSYPNDLLGLFGLPLRIQDVHDEEGNTHLGIVVQSPKFDDERTFISAALSYDPGTGVTSGFLGYIHDRLSGPERELGKGTMDNVLDGVMSKAFGIHTLNPLLLPVLILNSLHDFNENQLEKSRTLTHKAELTINEMSKIFSESWNSQRLKIKNMVDSAKRAMKRYDTAHRYLALSQETLLSESFPFSKDLGENCLKASRHLKIWADAQTTMRGREQTVTMPGLEILITRLTEIFERHEGRRDRLYKRMKVATDALYTLTQFLLQRLDVANSNAAAKTANRQNRMLMGISIISALFLPGTAIATLFGMVEFFTIPSEGVLKLDPSWIIYWKITIPITAFVVLCIILFQNWRTMQDWTPSGGPHLSLNKSWRYLRSRMRPGIGMEGHSLGKTEPSDSGESQTQGHYLKTGRDL